MTNVDNTMRFVFRFIARTDGSIYIITGVMDHADTFVGWHTGIEPISKPTVKFWQQNFIMWWFSLTEDQQEQLRHRIEQKRAFQVMLGYSKEFTFNVGELLQYYTIDESTGFIGTARMNIENPYYYEHIYPDAIGFTKVVQDTYNLDLGYYDRLEFIYESPRFRGIYNGSYEAFVTYMEASTEDWTGLEMFGYTVIDLIGYNVPLTYMSTLLDSPVDRAVLLASEGVSHYFGGDYLYTDNGQIRSVAITLPFEQPVGISIDDSGTISTIVDAVLGTKVWCRYVYVYKGKFATGDNYTNYYVPTQDIYFAQLYNPVTGLWVNTRTVDWDNVAMLTAGATNEN